MSAFETAEFMSDARDDLASYEWIPSPAEMLAEQDSPVRVANVLPGFVQVANYVRGIVTADPAFLALVGADLVAEQVSLIATQQAALLASHLRPYTTTRKQGNKVKSFAIAAGVVDAPHRTTLAERVAAENRRWGR